MKTIKARKIFERGYKTAQMAGEMKHLCIYVDSPKFTMRLKLQLIDIAREYGLNWQIDGSKLYNSYTKRHFKCTNIVNV